MAVKLSVRHGHTITEHHASLASQVRNLIKHSRIKTTLAQAKAVRPFAEKMLTLGKRGNLEDWRNAVEYLHSRGMVNKLFKEIAPRSAGRNGGYTRIIKLGPRLSDSAPMAYIEWVDSAPAVEGLASKQVGALAEEKADVPLLARVSSHQEGLKGKLPASSRKAKRVKTTAPAEKALRAKVRAATMREAASKTAPRGHTMRKLSSLPTALDHAATASRENKMAQMLLTDVAANNPDVNALCDTYKLRREELSHLTGFSLRSLAEWAAGKLPSMPAKRRLHEVRRMLDALAEIIEPAFIPEWLRQPNAAFGRLTPLQMIELGEIDRLWAMIHDLSSGQPS